MNIIKCRDIGFNCDFIATGSAAEADSVIQKMLVHIKEDHAGLSDEDLAEIEARMSVPLSRGRGCGAL